MMKSLYGSMRNELTGSCRSPVTEKGHDDCNPSINNMMKPIYQLIVFVYFFAAACGPKVQQSVVPENPATVTPKEGELQSVIFGRYCGHCRSRCATMYELRVSGNSSSLFMDTTDSFKNNYNTPTVTTPVSDSKKIDLAKNLASKIPAVLLHSAKTNERFGCPDCADQCGFYVELRQGGVTRQFYIDTRYSELEQPVRDFAMLLDNTTTQLRGEAY